MMMMIMRMSDNEFNSLNNFASIQEVFLFVLFSYLNYSKRRETIAICINHRTI